jgi:hypothetical protein
LRLTGLEFFINKIFDIDEDITKESSRRFTQITPQSLAEVKTGY